MKKNSGFGQNKNEEDQMKKKDIKRLEKKHKVKITVVDSETALKVLRMRLKSEEFMTDKLIKEVASMQSHIDHLNRVVEHREQLLESRDDHIDHLNKEFAEEIESNKAETEKRLEAIVDHFTLNESLFLQKLKQTLGSVTKKSNKTPLLAALQAVSELIEEKLEEINGNDEAEKSANANK